MSEIFQNFGSHGDSSEWSKQVREWKGEFPYRSFIHKNDGMNPADSPDADQRFLVCFGSRVASELHRRPEGRHILTDQNNIGCHGFWTMDESSNMLARMAELWKPPTCQLAEMAFTMKKQFLTMFQKMNERLFDAIPSLMMDEDFQSKGILGEKLAGPEPLDPQHVKRDD